MAKLSELHPKLITWLSNTSTVNIYDTITKNDVSFNINASILERVDGIMVAISLYVRRFWDNKEYLWIEFNWAVNGIEIGYANS